MGIDKDDPEPQHRSKKIGQLLLEENLIKPQQLSRALSEQARLNKTSPKKYKLGEVLMMLKYITLPQLHAVLLKQTPRTQEERENLALIKEQHNQTKKPAKKDSTEDGWLQKLRNRWRT